MSYSAWIIPSSSSLSLRVRRRLHDLAARVPPAGGERQTFVAVDHDAQVSRKTISLHRYSGCCGRSRRGHPDAATRGSRRCCSAPNAGPSRPTSWPAGWSRPWHAPRRPSRPGVGSWRRLEPAIGGVRGKSMRQPVSSMPTPTSCWTSRVMYAMKGVMTNWTWLTRFNSVERLGVQPLPANTSWCR